MQAKRTDQVLEQLCWVAMADCISAEGVSIADRVSALVRRWSECSIDSRRFQSAVELEESLRRVSRRMILVGATGLGVTGFSGAFLKEHFWPSSAVRLAVLPPSMKNVDTLAELRAADTLAHELDYLRLALEQAAAYVVQRGTRFQDYLVSFRKRRLELLERQQPRMGNYSRSVATTWELNFSEVEQTPAAADLLRVSGFLAPEDIPLDPLAPGLAQLDDSLAQAIASFEQDPVVLDEVLEPLLRYSLVS